MEQQNDLHATGERKNREPSPHEKLTALATKMREKVAADHLQDVSQLIGKQAFEALPTAQTLAEFLTYAELSCDYLFQDQNITSEYKAKALENLRQRVSQLCGEQWIDDPAKNLSPHEVLLAAVRLFAIVPEERWMPLLDRLKIIVNVQRSRLGLSELQFAGAETGPDANDPLARIWEKTPDYPQSVETASLTPYEVGEKTIAEERENGGPNQDAVMALESGSIGAFDGVSAAFDGATASRLSSEAFKAVLELLPPDATPEEVKDAYALATTLAISRMRQHRQGLHHLHDDRLWNWRRQNVARPEREQQAVLATTFACATVVKEGRRRTAVYSYSGDSRVYVVKNTGRVVCLTTDHGVLQQDWIDSPKALQDKFDNVRDPQKQLPEDEQFLFNFRNLVDQELSEGTIHSSKEPTVGEYRLADDDIALFCTTDGIHDNLTTREMEQTLLGEPIDSFPEFPEGADAEEPAAFERLRNILLGLRNINNPLLKGESGPLLIDPQKLPIRLNNLADNAHAVAHLPSGENKRSKEDDISISWLVLPAA